MRLKMLARRRVFALAVAALVGVALVGLQPTAGMAEGPKAKSKPAASPAARTKAPDATTAPATTPTDSDRTKQGHKVTGEDKAAPAATTPIETDKAATAPSADSAEAAAKQKEPKTIVKSHSNALNNREAAPTTPQEPGAVSGQTTPPPEPAAKERDMGTSTIGNIRGKIETAPGSGPAESRTGFGRPSTTNAPVKGAVER